MAYAVIFLLLALVPSFLCQLPTGWKACKRSASDYDACFIRELTRATNDVASGGNTFGSPALDPLRLERLHLPKQNSSVSVDLTFTRVDIVGIKKFKILEAKNDWKTMKAVLFFPDVVAAGDYKVDGKVLVVPIVGEGKCNITFYDVNLLVDVTWKKIEKGRKKYFQMGNLKADLVPKKMSIQLDNLYNGNKALGANTNLFLNENWEQIFAELKPGVNQGFAQALKQIANIILSKIPADDIDIS